MSIVGKSLLGNVVRAIAAGFATLALFSVAACITATPRNDRIWYPYLSRATHAELGKDRFEISAVSDWTYNEQGPVTQTYTAESFAYDDLRNVWFVLEPQPDMTIAAHTFLLFEFKNDRLLGITIEARREENEDYSAVKGAFNAYELSYLWAEARDLLTRRAVMLQHETFIYPLTLTDETKSQLLRTLLERTDALESKPRFYNTLFSNCTNELAKAAKLKWHSSFILTGKSDQHLFKLKVIPGASFAEARKSADMTAFVRSSNSMPDIPSFDAHLLRELRTRAGQTP